jgi:diguanylate cyclase
MAADKVDAWKRKYHDALHQLEEKDKQVADVDDLMRHSVARLSLMANGLHPRLDRQLEKLRKVARSGGDTAAIRDLLDEASKTVREVELKLSSATDNARARRDALVDFLAGIEFPGDLGDSAASLQRRLDREDRPEALLILVREYANLLQRALGRVAADREKNQAGGSRSQDAKKPLYALLDRLMTQNPAGRMRFDALRRQVQDDDSELLTDSIAGIARLFAPDDTRNGTTGEPGRPEATSLPATSLLKLMDHLAVPAERLDLAKAIRERLLRGELDWERGLDAVAQFIGDISRFSLQEKTDLEGFLRQLTQRLNDLDRHLRGAESERKASAQSGRDLDSAVMAHVSGIESSVREAGNLVVLRETIQHRLDGIREHLDDYRRQEAQRQARLEEELRNVTARLHTMEKESTQLRTHLEESQRHSLFDPLTGAGSRLAYEERLAQEYASFSRHGTPLSMIVLDVDGFKSINDTYGHKAGDRALALIARVIKQLLRESDFIARYGGEEFVILLPHTPEAAVYGIADKLRAAIETTNFHNSGVRVPITVSAGYATFCAGDRPEEVFERCDRALYRAKRDGRNRCAGGDGEIPSQTEPGRD